MTCGDSARRSSSTCWRCTRSFSVARSRTARYDLEPRDHSQLSLAIRAVYRRCQLTGEQPRETLLQEELYRRSHEEREDGNVELASHLAQLAEGLARLHRRGRGRLPGRSADVDPGGLAAGDLRHPRGRRRARRRRDVHDRRAPRAGARSEPAVEHAHRGPWGGRTFLVVDEGWKMLERRSTGRWINEQARRSRHNRLFLIAISQKLSDFLQHPEGEALVSQSSIQLFLEQLDGQTARHPARARADRRGDAHDQRRSRRSRASTPRRSCATAAAAAG